MILYIKILVELVLFFAEYDQVERFNDRRQCKRLLSTPHTPKSVDYSEANDEGAYDYRPPQSTYARRYIKIFTKD